MLFSKIAFISTAVLILSSKFIENFEKIYKNITRDIVEDWKRLSEYSSDYYDKFNNDTLEQEEKETFDKVTVNMFARFQIFNEQIEKVVSQRTFPVHFRVYTQELDILYPKFRFYIENYILYIYIYIFTF